MANGSTWSYLQTILLGIAGFCFGPLILSIGNNPVATNPDKFVNSGQFKVWIAVFGAQTALWFVLALPLWRELPEGGIKENKLQFGLIILALLVLTLMISLVRPPERPLFWHQTKMVSLQACGMAVALLAIHGMGLIYRKLDHTKDLEGGDGKPPEESVKRLIDLRQRLEQLLLAAGTIIGAATLATGGLRSALIAYRESNRELFPKEYVLLYGLIYSMFLAAVYVPVHLKLQSRARELRERLLPFKKGESESWASWHSNRKALDELLQLQVNPVTGLFNGISILSPLAGSIVGLLIGK